MVMLILKDAYYGLVYFMLCMVFCVSFAHAKDIEYETFTLKNGLQIVLVPSHKVPAVSHMIWYKVGAADEVDGKTGLAHLFEHMMFKATKNMEAGEFSNAVAKAGGNDNAFTNQDYTGYYQNIARDTLPMVMQKEADRMKNLLVNEAQFQKEKRVVLEERSSRIDNNPVSVLVEKMNAALFPDHPYGRPVIGFRKDIEALTVEDAKKFYQHYYAPNNAVLIVVGDITRSALEPMVRKYYGVIKAGNISERKITPGAEKIAATEIIHHDVKVKKEQWLRFYTAPQYHRDCKECYALTLLSYLLAESPTSLLHNELVVEQKIAASINAHYDDLQIGPARFSLSAIPSNGITIEMLEQKIEELIEQAKQQAFSEEAIQRAKNMLAAQVIYAQEDFTSLGRIFGTLYVIGKDGDYVKEWEKNIRSVTAEQIQNAAQKILNHDHAVTGILLPKESEKAE